MGSGNNDTAEMAIGGLLLALQKSRPRSTVYLFTDGDAKDWERYKEALTLIYNKKITVYVVRSDRGTPKGREGMNSSVYFLISAKSGGQVLYGNKTDVGRLLELTANLASSSDVTLLSIDSSTPALSPYGHNWTVLVDSSVNAMTVSVSGSDPSIFLFDQNNIRVKVSSFNSIQLASIAVVQWLHPTAGRMTVQVMAESSYTLRVKGLSSLDLQYRFVVPERIEHFGYYPVRGRPRAGSALSFTDIVLSISWFIIIMVSLLGDSVYISLTVVGLTSDQRVERLFLQEENGTVIDTVLVEKLNDTNYRYMTVDALTVPEVSFQVGLEGTEISTGASFKRIDVTVVIPSRFRVVLQTDSKTVFKQGTTSTVRFLVQNGPDAPPDTFSFNITDELDLVSTSTYSILSLGSNENRSVEVRFRVPACFWFTGINTVTVTVDSETSDAYTSLTMATFIDSDVYHAHGKEVLSETQFIAYLLISVQYVDNEAPVCVLQSVGNCSFAGDTCNSTWRVEWHVLDRISPIYQIKPLPSFNTTTVQYDRSRSNSSNQWISVTADIPCCDNGTILTVIDFSGNKVNCSVTKESKEPRCTTTCRNGGKCRERDRCACLGGYFGKRCENGKNNLKY